MDRKDIKPIVKTFYDALEEGKILGRKCTHCGHIEYPPYLACNECGNLDTEWVEISGKAVATMISPIAPFHVTVPFKERIGDYCMAMVQPENCSELNTCLIGVTAEQALELEKKVPVPVKPVIVQEDGYKMVFWKLDD